MQKPISPPLCWRRFLLALGAGWVLLMGTSGCTTPAEARAEADQQVYAIIEKRREELSEFDPFTIDPATETLRQELIDGAELEPVDLEDLLVIAAENSREYRDEREDLFLVALTLTLQQWNFGVQESAGADASTSGTDNETVDQEAGAIWGWSKVFGSGLQVLGSLALRTVRLTSSASMDRSWDSFTRATLSITQPLLRGFGAEIVLEPLIQAERNVLYAARQFERFRSTFAFTVTQQYFDVLKQVNKVENEEENYRGLRALRLRNESFAEAGRLDQIQVGEAQQDELRARNSLLVERAALATDYDDFKFLLGLPITSNLPLDPAKYLSINTWEWLDLDPPEEFVIQTALSRRYDYMTAKDLIQDAERDVHVAADALRNGLGLEAGAVLQTRNDSPTTFDSSDVTWEAGLNFDLAIDKLPERNAYRASLINEARAKRATTKLHDEIVADLRQELRTLISARESYEIQKSAVALAEERVQSTLLSLEAGRTDTREVLQSQEALLTSRNALTAAFTAYILSGLALYRDMELLRVTPEGLLVDTGPIIAYMESLKS
ncbi:MAG: TolC family protein [Planctomycetota bacterium]|nr:TolC family protein [Planctomycetota bacterium]